MVPSIVLFVTVEALTQMREGEEWLYRGFGLTVTNQRLIFLEGGRIQTTTIDCIGMCEYGKRRRRALLWVVVLLCVIAVGIWVNDTRHGSLAAFFFILAGIVEILYVLLIETSLCIHTRPGRLIRIEVNGPVGERLQQAVCAIQRAHIDFCRRADVTEPSVR